MKDIRLPDDGFRWKPDSNIWAWDEDPYIGQSVIELRGTFSQRIGTILALKPCNHRPHQPLVQFDYPIKLIRFSSWDVLEPLDDGQISLFDTDLFTGE